ncbi:MAG: DNA repair protein RadA [bacterium]|nr:DNA repair protein RadA [bacterium]
MPTVTLVYTCAKCDTQFPKWTGRCTSCGEWGSVKKEPDRIDHSERENIPRATPGKTVSFATPSATKTATTEPTGFAPFDTVMDGGITHGASLLIAGQPGIGKSTLLSHVGLTVALQKKHVIYVTGEETPTQIRRRLERIHNQIPESFHFLDCTDTETVCATIEETKPQLVIIDSIQSMRLRDIESGGGSIGQVKASSARLTETARKSGSTLILVGQITKDGAIAGPRVLEHLVDTVLFFEGDRNHHYRILRVLKHRFGPTDESAVLNMTEKGLEAVDDISSELLRDRAKGVAGSTITCIVDGHRPMLIEIQALVSPAGYATPTRKVTGIDLSRLGIILAVLARRAGINVVDKDVYANAAGGIQAKTPSVDLALAIAIASAVKDKPLDPRLAVFGEIGLTGELRPVHLPDARLKELQRLGFRQVLIPKGQRVKAPKDLTLIQANELREALQMLHLI